MNVDQIDVLLSAFVLQDVDFILENLDTLFHFSQILAGRLNLTHVLVARILHFFIESDKRVQLEVGVLLLFGQIKNEKLLDFKLCTSFTGLSSGLGGSASHFCPDGHQEINLDDEHSFTSLHLLDEGLLSFDLLLKLLDASLAHVEVQTLLDELANIDHLVFLIILETVFEFALL